MQLDSPRGFSQVFILKKIKSFVFTHFCKC
jgi:hypothetical protein